MNEGGEWKNELRPELRPERRIELLPQRVGAHQWVLERRSGSASIIYNRLKEDDRFPGAQILAGVQWRLSILFSGGGFSAYQMVSGSDPANPYGSKTGMRI